MKVTIGFVSAMLVLGLTGVVHAANMFAGPLFPNGVGDSCACEVVNVSNSPKNIEIQVLNKLGDPIATSGVITVPAGAANAVSSGTGGLQYCKFVNAASGNFRATITCYFNGTDVVALPAR